MKSNYKYILLIVLLITMPMYLLVFITSQEMSKYDTGGTFVISERAYGRVEKVMVGNLEETFIVEGQYTSEESVFKKVDRKCGMSVDINDEVFVNQKLGACSNSEVSNVNGVVKAISFIDDNYLVEIINIDELIFAGYLKGIKQSLPLQEYVTFDGSSYLLYKKSNIMSDQGRKLFFKAPIEGNLYLEKDSLQFKTGVVVEDVLMILEDAIYTNYNGLKVVRVIDEDGNVLEEREVTAGIRGYGLVAVDGLSKEEYYDIEYGKYQNQKANE